MSALLEVTGVSKRYGGVQALSDFTGLLHVGGPERLSRLEMGQRLARFLGAGPAVIVPAGRADAPAAGPRPRDVSLDSSLWRRLFPALPWPTWEEALRRDAGEGPAPGAAQPG